MKVKSKDNMIFNENLIEKITVEMSKYEVSPRKYNDKHIINVPKVVISTVNGNHTYYLLNSKELQFFVKSIRESNVRYRYDVIETIMNMINGSMRCIDCAGIYSSVFYYEEWIRVINEVISEHGLQKTISFVNTDGFVGMDGKLVDIEDMVSSQFMWLQPHIVELTVDGKDVFLFRPGITRINSIFHLDIMLPSFNVEKSDIITIIKSGDRYVYTNYDVYEPLSLEKWNIVMKRIGKKEFVFEREIDIDIRKLESTTTVGWILDGYFKYKSIPMSVIWCLKPREYSPTMFEHGDNVEFIPMTLINDEKYI